MPPQVLVDRVAQNTGSLAMNQGKGMKAGHDRIVDKPVGFHNAFFRIHTAQVNFCIAGSLRFFGRAHRYGTASRTPAVLFIRRWIRQAQGG